MLYDTMLSFAAVDFEVGLAVYSVSARDFFCRTAISTSMSNAGLMVMGMRTTGQDEQQVFGRVTKGEGEKLENCRQTLNGDCASATGQGESSENDSLKFTEGSRVLTPSKQLVRNDAAARR